MRLSSRLLIGAIAGIAGTMAMTSAMRRFHKRLPARERYPLPPREIVDSAMAPPDALARPITIAAHFAYGAACGALLGAADPKMGRGAGALAGTAIWIGSYMGWIPALSLLKPANAHPLRRDALMISVHIVWGTATASAMRELSQAHDTIFAAGSAQDAP